MYILPKVLVVCGIVLAEVCQMVRQGFDAGEVKDVDVRIVRGDLAVWGETVHDGDHVVPSWTEGTEERISALMTD